MKRTKFMLLGSMGIFGTIGIFVRQIPLPSAAIAFCRGLLGLLFLIIIMLLTKKRPNISAIKRNLTFLLFSGAAIGFNWVLLFESYKHTTVATATICYYLAPLLLLLASPLLGEQITCKKLFCVGIALLGLVCVSGISKNGFPALRELKGIFLGVGAAVLYAFVMFLNKKLSPISAYDKTILQLGISTLVMLPYLLFTQPAVTPSLTAQQWLLLGIVGIVHTGFAYVLYFGSMKNLSAHTVAIYSYLDPAIAILLSALLLKEPMRPVNIVGAMLILGSALYSELPNRQNKKTIPR